MKQARFIFWKDVRHLWLELGVYSLLLVVYAFVAPMVWPGKSPNSTVAGFATLLKILMAASWLVLIARAVHADSLVGEEEFWLTRPYRWQSLLAAKVLFVAVCVGLPYVLMQWAILLEVGLNPFADKVGMAMALLRFGFNVMLPFFIVATVTQNLAMTFTVIAGLIVTWAGLLTLILANTDMRMSPPYSLFVFYVVFVGLMMAVAIYQYARRQTMYSRLAIAGVLALFLLTLLGYDRGGFGAPVKALIRSHYPISRSMRLVLTGKVPYDEQAGDDIHVSHNQVEIKLPVRVEGLSSNAKMRDTHVLVEVEGGDLRYTPPWQSALITEHTIGFVMPKDVFDRLSHADSRVHLELVAEELLPVHAMRVAASDRFPGPMNGVCGLVQGKVVCRYAYREWTPVRVEMTGCGRNGAATLRHVPAGGAPDPVVNEVLPFKGEVCPGAEIQFTEYGSMGDFRVVLDAQALKIGQYQAR